MNHWRSTLEELVRTRRSALVGYAYLLTTDRLEAEDLVQDSLIKTFSRARSDLTLQAAEAYVRKTIRNTYLDGFRRRKRWAAVRHLFTNPEELADAAASVSDQLDLSAALRQLPTQERACLVLRYYEDLTVPQIAAELSLAQGTVKRYLSDSLDRLEAILQVPAGLTTPQGSTS